MVQRIHEIVTRLSRSLPQAFIFVIDVTDRTFLYASTKEKHYERVILELDGEKGIDTLVGNKSHLIDRSPSFEVGLKSLGLNTYAGYCLKLDGIGAKGLAKAQAALTC
ncbi:MAG: hypothetical protein AAF616_06850 [Bacteroidota bacterium]